MPWTERVELGVGAAVVAFVCRGAGMGLRQLSEQEERNAMTPYPILNFIIWAAAVLLVIVLFVAVLVWAVNKLDADAAEAMARRIDVALGRGWERLAPGRAG